MTKSADKAVTNNTSWEAVKVVFEFLCLTIIGPVIVFVGCAFFPFGPLSPLITILVLIALRRGGAIFKRALITGTLAGLVMSAIFAIYAWLIYSPSTIAHWHTDGTIEFAGISLARARPGMAPLGSMINGKFVTTPSDYVYVHEDKGLEAVAAMLTYLSAGWIGLLISRSKLTQSQLFTYAAVVLYAYVLLGSAVTFGTRWNTDFGGVSRYSYEAFVFYTLCSSMVLIPILMMGAQLGRRFWLQTGTVELPR